MSDDSTSNLTASRRLAVLPLRDVVVYPHMVVPLFVGRKPSILALEDAMAVGKEILLVAQRKPEVDEPGAKDIYGVGTLATVLQMMKMPDNTVKVMVQGALRANLKSLKSGNFFSAEFAPVSEEAAAGKPEEKEALRRSLLAQFESYVKLHKNVPPEALAGVSGLDDIGRLADTIAAHMQLALEKKQVVLETGDPIKRMEYLVGLMGSEIDMLKIERKIRGRVKTQMEKSQREYYLNEQMKAIQKELGELEEAPDEITSLENGIKEAGMPKEAQEKAMTELGKLKMMAPMSAEATVVRNYLDWLLKVPWKKQRRINGDLARAARILEEDHYGLEKVKERILEYLAVQKRVRALKGPILCLVGPPGVGKTSLGRSIARATNRAFVRMSLGGVRDEAEIRGHRRTYIGALPGKIVQNLARTGVRNPLFLLDEVDKMSMDFRGDPSSALLEVLDPEQNSAFNDHYLEVDFDLSRTMFVCTANTLAIPPPLLDRMEVLRIPGYTEDEKLEIARNYLIAKQMKQNGVRKGELRFTVGGLRNMIRHYTREAGGAKPGARDRPRMPEGREEAVAAPHAAGNLHWPAPVGAVPWGAEVPLRPGGEPEPRRPGAGAGLDRSGRRVAAYRGFGHARQGQTDAHRQAGRCDAGIHPGRGDRGSRARRPPGARPRLPVGNGYACACSGRRYPQGRPQCGHRHVHRPGVGSHGNPGARRRGHDRRNHPGRRGAAGWRPEGETAGRAPGRHRAGPDSGGVREGPRRNPGQRQAQAGYPFRALDRPGARAGPGAVARGEPRPCGRPQRRGSVTSGKSAVAAGSTPRALI